MATIIAGIATVHNPNISGIARERQTPETSRIYAEFKRLSETFEHRRPDLVIVFSSEHIVNFLRTNVPAFCVGIGESYPVVEEFNLPGGRYPGHAGAGRRLVEYAYAHGFDVSHSIELALDHGTAVPLHYLFPLRTVPVIPILVNTLFPPLPTLQRAHELGKMVRDFVEEELGNMQVLLIGTGGLVHSVGERRAAPPDYGLDEFFVRQFAAGDVASILSMPAAVLHENGNGTNEIRNWLALEAAVHGKSARVLVREPAGGPLNMGNYQVIWE